MSVSDADMIEFRDAVPADRAAIAGILGASVVAAPGGSVFDGSTQASRLAFDEIASDHRHHLVVGVFAREVVCCAEWFMSPTLADGGGHRAQISWAAVTPSMRRRGIGYVLIDHVMHQARGAGASSISMAAGPQDGDRQRFAERLGFEATGVVVEQQL